MRRAKTTCIVWLFLCSNALALTPFSLEHLTHVHLTLSDKGKLLPESETKAYKETLTSKLRALGVQTTPTGFSNVIVKIQSTKVQNQALCHISLMVVENTRIARKTPVDAIAITYSNDDWIETCTPAEIKESIFFLFDEFAEQYKEENPK